MRIIKFDENYYCIMKKKFSIDSAKDAYMNKAKVIRDSLAENYIENIFNYVFNNTIDLLEDYYDFYQEEYPDFRTFLYQKELLSKQQIIEINIGEDETLIELNMDSNSYNISNLFDYSEDYIDIFNQMLEGIDE